MSRQPFSRPNDEVRSIANHGEICRSWNRGKYSRSLPAVAINTCTTSKDVVEGTAASSASTTMSIVQQLAMHPDREKSQHRGSTWTHILEKVFQRPPWPTASKPPLPRIARVHQLERQKLLINWNGKNFLELPQ